MVASKVELFNQALSLVGGRSTVSDPAENSREANLCNLWYPTVRDNVLKSAPWPCAKAWARLALLAEKTDSGDWTGTNPAPGWNYAYARPDDCLSPRFLHSFGRFEQARYGNNLAIMTNEPSAILSYIARCEEINLWSVDLQQAVTYLLAAHVSYALQGKESRWDRMFGAAVQIAMDARTAAANEEDLHIDTIPDWISARGFNGTVREARYIYPYENLNMVAVQ